MSVFKRIGIISLGEAGNLGDDLILLSVIDSLRRYSGLEEVAFLSHGAWLDWNGVSASLGTLTRLSRRPSLSETASPGAFLERFADCDAVIFGGGGLLQDVHHPLRPYHWMRYIPRGVPVLAVGLGLGPLSSRWISALGDSPECFSSLYVRDGHSLNLATEIGWHAKRSADCVSGDLVGRLVTSSADNGCVGLAVRAWPGLSPRAVAEWVDEVVGSHRCERVLAFVLEARSGSGPDVGFTSEVLRHLRAPNDMLVYDPSDVPGFVSAMSGCRAAVSMKLHSSAVFGFFGIPVYPILYAPKTASLFGMPWRGLEIVKQSLAPQLPADDAQPTEEVILQWLQSADLAPPEALPFSNGQRRRLQARSLQIWAWRRVARRLGLARTLIRPERTYSQQ